MSNFLTDPEFTRFPFKPLPFYMQHLAIPGEFMLDYDAGIAYARSLDGLKNIQLNDPTAIYHIEDYNNPHMVTKEQVGLGNVDNVKQATYEDLLKHKQDYNNPHMVTKEQVGLGNVKNVEQVSKEEMEAFKQMCDDYIDEMKGIIDSFGQVLAKKYKLEFTTDPTDAIVKVFYNGQWNTGKIHQLPDGTYQYEVSGPESIEP